MPSYGDDLSHVHDQGFASLAAGAAGVILETLESRAIERGKLVDLGCGSGTTAAPVAAAGHAVLGIDQSSAMLALARKRCPEGKFRRASLLDVELPACDVVSAIGEVLNYAFDPRMGMGALERLFRRVHAALRPGGSLLFDVVTTRTNRSGRGAREGRDWAVLVEWHTDRARRRLTRKLTIFRRVGSVWRRRREVHVQHLFEAAAIERLLRKSGFTVRRTRRYGDVLLLPGRSGFVARKR